jgi:hypothetical protein
MGRRPIITVTVLSGAILTKAFGLAGGCGTGDPWAESLRRGRPTIVATIRALAVAAAIATGGVVRIGLTNMFGPLSSQGS